MNPKKVMLWIVLVVVVTFLIWIVASVLFGPLTYGQTATQEQRESLLQLVNYCYEHADSPNPIQDLIDKGFLSPEFKGETCISVKAMYNNVVRDLQIQQDKLDKEFNEKMQRSERYFECARNETTTQEECYRIMNGTK